MYEQHFGLDRAPFSLLPDPNFLYLGKQHSSAKAFLESSAIVHDSFVVITGAIGAGKTTLVEGYLAELSANETVIVRINQTQISPTGFLRLLLDGLGLKAFKARKPELLSKFRKFMAGIARRERNVVLVIDEAQNLSRDVLEEIRMLTGGEHAAFLSIVLVGQPEFLETLESPGLMQLAQRCRLRSHIEALPESESAAYIDHRIMVAGGDPDKLFTKTAKDAVFSATGGVPRLINSLCDTALICAFADGLKIVDHKEIHAALRELNWHTPKLAKPKTAVASGKRARNKRSSKGAENQEQASARIVELQAEIDRMHSLEEELLAARQEIASLRTDGSAPEPQAEALASSFARLDALQTQIEDLSNSSCDPGQLQILAADISRLTEEYSDVLIRVDDTEAILAKLEQQSADAIQQAQQLATQQEKIAALESSNTTQAEHIQALRIEISEASSKAALADDAQQSLARESEALAKSLEDLEQLRAEIADRAEEREKLSAELASAEQRIAQLSTSLTEHNESLAGRDNSIQTLKNEVRSKNRLIDELHDQLALLTDASEGLKDLASENESLAEQLHKEQDTTRQYAARIEQLEQVEVDQHSAFADLERSAEQLRVDLAESRAENADLARQYAAEKELTASNAARIAEFESVQNEHAQVVADLEQTIERLRTDLAESQEEKTELARQYAAEQELTAGSETRIAELKSAEKQQAQVIADLEKTIEQLRADLEESQNESTELARQYAAEQELTAGSETRIAELESAQNQQAQVIGDLEKTIEQLRADLAENRDENTELARQYAAEQELTASKEKQIEELESAHSQQSRLIADLEQASEHQRAQLSDSMKENQQLSEQLRVLKEQESAGAARLAELKQAENAQKDVIAGLETDLERMHDDVAANLRELEELRVDLEASEVGRAQLTGTIEKLREKLAGRDNTISTVEAEIRRKNLLIDELHDKLEPLPDLRSEVLKLGEEKEQLSSELQSRNERIGELQEALSLGQQHLDDARREIEEAQDGQVNLHVKVSELKTELTTLQNNEQSRDELVTSLQTECDNRKKDLRKLRKELDESMDQSRELRDSLELGEQRIRDLEKELSAAMETISEMGEASAQVNSNSENYRQEVHEQKEQLSALTQELTDKSAQLEALESEIRHKTETIKALQLDVDSTAEARKTEAASASEYEALIAQLRGEVEARDVKIRALAGTSDETDLDVKALRAQVEEQSAMMQQLDNELAASKEEAEELRAELRGLDREFNETSVLTQTQENPESEQETASHTALEAGLIVTTNGSPARRVPLRDERLIIGRTGDSDIRIDNEFASRHHAQIVFRNGRYILEDLNSTNGIYVNSRRVSKRQLRDRDVIRIGQDKLIFVLDQHTSH